MVLVKELLRGTEQGRYTDSWNSCSPTGEILIAVILIFSLIIYRLFSPARLD